MAVYLIPSLLAVDAVETIPPYVLEAIKDCQVFFAENERTTRRFFKQIWKEMVIDNYEWYTMGEETDSNFIQKIKEGKNIGIISEAGCPGVADPGQKLIAIAQQMNVVIKPLVGPSSIILALMASGMNGQSFQFVGYLPIDNAQRTKTIKELEAESKKKDCTQIFIETPYRNNQLIETLVKTGHPQTKLCIAVDITGKEEWIKTKTINEWQKQLPNIHKKTAIFLVYAG
jgi:16S rRNA (cytidine1402-2'-O)-methyltransferase